LQNKVIFAGYQDQSRDLPKFYNSCDLLVLPSVGPPESFGMVIIEAMASGLPVIVSALPGPSELVDDGVDGFVVPVGDVLLLKERIQSLVDDTALRKRMGDAAYRKVAERYSWSTIGERLEEAILGIVRSPKSLC
jgi:glycosyltransferase involved in cell wall biosynthesis